ncbi:MAG TPA: hypothetical protein PKI11_06440 [Candidatus Hydrogenedentes bacterium]|nr:hypothetical protein [Candidatus Hydrogenedentota bacterium]HNT88515.1 hypothetical protein [Candidatus Hydrogenedentota bacterium]
MTTLMMLPRGPRRVSPAFFQIDREMAGNLFGDDGIMDDNGPVSAADLPETNEGECQRDVQERRS